MACTKTEPKNDLFLHCRRKTKQLSKNELSNVAPASFCNCQEFFNYYDLDVEIVKIETLDWGEQQYCQKWDLEKMSKIDLGNNGEKIFQKVWLGTKCQICFCISTISSLISEFLTILLLPYSYTLFSFSRRINVITDNFNICVLLTSQSES